MPLEKVGRQYADKLFQNSLEDILAKQRERLSQVAADFSRRNMIMSGAYFSAYTKVILEQILLLAEAKVEGVLKAYEKSGLSFDESALIEITGEVSDFCHSQQHNAVGAMGRVIGQAFVGSSVPENLSSALTQQLISGVDQITARISRNLSIKRDEVVLEGIKVRRAYGAGLGKQWDVFICHASEDKKEFVRILADALIDSGLSVWYDEFTLKVGDSLLRRIDEGLSKSRFGIVVLSNFFFAKEWPQHELNGLMSRQIAGTKVILPVWHNISFEEVQSKSPILSGIVAVKSSDGIVVVVKQLREAMGL